MDFEIYKTMIEISQSQGRVPVGWLGFMAYQLL